MTLIVDASVAMKWFVRESGSAAALDLLRSDDQLVVPDLIIAEVCNAAWKSTRRDELELAQYREVLGSLPALFDEIVPGAELAAPAGEMARLLDHPVYDCFYVALAELRGGWMTTADRHLIGKLRGSPWQNRVRLLDEAGL
jgi:predicted nucleic acid-binding protein